MADDPVTISNAVEINVAPGLKFLAFTVTGPADYDASGGAACDLSSYFGTKIYGVSGAGYDAEGDELWKVAYQNDDLTDLDGGFVHFSGTKHGTSGEGESLGDAADTTDLSGIQFQMVAWGY